LGEAVTTFAALASAQTVLVIIGSTLQQPWKIPLLIAFVHFAMVFRGLLFQELSSGNARTRAFRRRMGN
jgi:membrane protease YdiL (CAAX protease family)